MWPWLHLYPIQAVFSDYKFWNLVGTLKKLSNLQIFQLSHTQEVPAELDRVHSWSHRQRLTQEVWGGVWESNKLPGAATTGPGATLGEARSAPVIVNCSWTSESSEAEGWPNANTRCALDLVNQNLWSWSRDVYVLNKLPTWSQCAVKFKSIKSSVLIL